MTMATSRIPVFHALRPPEKWNPDFLKKQTDLIERTRPGIYQGLGPDAIIRTAIGKMEDMPAVPDYGSVALGQDASPAAKKAVAAALQYEKGGVYWPDGNYVLTEPLVNAGGVTHYGLSNPSGGV